MLYYHILACKSNWQNRKVQQEKWCCNDPCSKVEIMINEKEDIRRRSLNIEVMKIIIVFHYSTHLLLALLHAYSWPPVYKPSYSELLEKLQKKLHERLEWSILMGTATLLIFIFFFSVLFFLAYFKDGHALRFKK